MSWQLRAGEEEGNCPSGNTSNEPHTLVFSWTESILPVMSLLFRMRKPRVSEDTQCFPKVTQLWEHQPGQLDSKAQTVSFVPQCLVLLQHLLTLGTLNCSTCVQQVSAREEQETAFVPLTCCHMYLLSVYWVPGPEGPLPVASQSRDNGFCTSPSSPVADSHGD